MDLKELVQISTAEAHGRQFLKDLTDAFGRFSKPSIAAVTGFAVSLALPLSSARVAWCTDLITTQHSSEAASRLPWR